MNPASATRHSRRPAARRGFGLLELATALAFLCILLGLSVSLARFVRATSAEQITRQVLRQLEQALNAHDAKGTLPPALPEDVRPPAAARSTEADWADFARRSNGVVATLAGVDEIVSDAWGHPIGYLDFEQDSIGMAPHGRPFCFSPGPDGRYLTQDDNLYSYEQLSPLRPATSPAAGGHRE